MRSLVRLLLPLLTASVIAGCQTEIDFPSDGEAPICLVREPSLEFGQIVADGSFVDRSFVLRNVGGGLLSGTIAELGSPWIVLSGGGRFSLGPGGARRVVIRFQPTDAGTSNAEILLGTSCRAVTVRGSATAADRCTVTPSLLDFGRLAIGQSSQLRFTIQNQGGAELRGTVGTPCVGFELVRGGGDYALSPGASHDVDVRFRPTNTGDFNCALELGADACEDLILSGVAEAAPQCRLTPAELDFGAVEIGAVADRTFRIENTGGGRLVGLITEGCQPFSITAGGGGFDLGPGEGRTVVVRFQPQRAAEEVCILTTGNDACGTMPARGRGLPSAACSIEPASLDFGAVATGSSRDLPFVIRNLGGVAISGTVAAECGGFSIVSGGGAFVLEPEQNRTVVVRFQPTGVGSATCAVSVSDVCQSVRCDGRGEAPPACELVPVSLLYGDVTIGESRSLSFQVRNAGGGLLSGSISADCEGFALLSGGGVYTLGAGEAREVTLRFAPLQATAFSCTVETGTALCNDLLATGSGVPGPQCAVTPSILDFGGVSTGQSKDLTFSIENRGGGVLRGSVAASCGAFAVVLGAGSYELASNQVHNVTLRFQPTSLGSQECTFDLGNTLCALSVTGVGETAAQCVLDPTSLAYGSVPLGSSSEKTFRISNAGGGTLSGTIASGCADFSVTAGGGAYALTAGQSRLVTVRFAPATLGGESCALATGGPCATLALSGTGIEAGSCQVSPLSLDFGRVPLGDREDRSFTITNTGTTNLTGTLSEACTGYAFVSGSGTYVLLPGQNRVVTVRFQPPGVGVFDCVIETGAGACVDVSCTGEGEPEPLCQVTPTSLDFGTVTIGQSVDRVFEIANIGGGQVTGNVGEICSQYTIVSGAGAFSLGAGERLAVTARFQPTLTGTQVCNLDTGSNPCVDVSATGVGERAPACSVTPSGLSFGTVQIGQTKDLSFTLRNSGDGTLEGTVSEACAGFEILSGGGPFALAANQTVSVNVRFAPDAATSYSCSIETGTAACGSITATGTGEPPPSCSVTPTTIELGTVTIGSFVEADFIIQNTGGGTISGSVSESCTGYSVVSGGGAYILGAGVTREVTVRFAPTTTGGQLCTVETGSTLCADVSLSGIGEQGPICAIDITTLDFGTVLLGSSADRTFQISNTGGGTLSGTITESCETYSLVSGGGAFSLANGASRSVTVRFTPTSETQYTCAVAFGTAWCVDVQCFGTGQGIPQCTVSPTSLNFGDVAVGSTADRTFTVRNTGGGTLTGSVSESCADYSLPSGGGSYSLPAGGTRTVTVRFAPTGLGTSACNVAPGNNCAGQVACTGTGAHSFATHVHNLILVDCVSCHAYWTGDVGTDYQTALTMVTLGDPPASPLLYYPSNQAGAHQGGLIWATNSSSYGTVLSWILAGALP